MEMWLGRQETGQTTMVFLKSQLSTPKPFRKADGLSPGDRERLVWQVEDVLEVSGSTRHHQLNMGTGPTFWFTQLCNMI